MNQICAKIYYILSTGEVVLITPEMQSSVETITKEQDMQVYPQLKDKSANDVDFIELEYGTLKSTFANVKSYSIDKKTKKLNCIYYTKDEMEELQKQNDFQIQQTQELNDRVSSISEYLNQDTSSIADIEDYILQIEKNKILN